MLLRTVSHVGTCSSSSCCMLTNYNTTNITTNTVNDNITKCLVSLPSNSKLSQTSLPMANSIRIAVVGDVHNDWNLVEDSKALQFLRPDLVLFTGDFGNENVELVRSIANLEFSKAAILGNHDAWKTQQFAKRTCFCRKKDGVQLQLEHLGGEHVGYQRLDYPSLKLSIVGGRPFSCGGDRLFRIRLLESRYGVNDMNGSANRIYQAALGAPEDHSVILLAHNGPTGLGSNINDICGRDWFSGGGDHGDPDLEQAISKLKQTTKLSIPLVVFGHMHKELANKNGLRKMIVDGADNTTYLNGAIVPRVKILSNQLAPENKTEGTMRAFTLVELSQGQLEKIAETWVSVSGEDTRLQEELTLYHRGSKSCI